MDAPDPLFRYRIPILGVFAVVLVMGGAYIVSRSNRAQPAVAGKAPAVEPVTAPRDRQSLLLDAMKEELFQLELDRQQGKVSAEEYATAKAALDETIKRAVSRGQSG